MVSPAVKTLQSESSVSTYSSVPAVGPMLDRVYSLRYKSYSEEGYINPCSSQKFMDEFDGLPNCTSFLTYYGRQIIGSIRACVYRPGEDHVIPVMEVFEKEMADQVDMTAAAVEANKFVVDPQYQSRGGAAARFGLFRNIIEVANLENAKTILAAVRTEHIKFYRALSFHQISDAKSYPHLSFETVLLQCTDIEAFKRIVWRKTEPKPKRSREAVNDAVLNYGHH